jgi:hypothetical protein
LICFILTVTAALDSVSSVVQFIFFLVACSCMILEGFYFVAFFVCVKAISFCIRLSCRVCLYSVILGIWSCLFCGRRGCSLPEAFFSVRLSKSSFLTYIKVWVELKCCTISKLFVLTFLKIVLLTVPINCKNFANLNSASLEHW